MATLPSCTQVSGKHNAIYEAYYKQVDPKGEGTIEAMSAAKFLKKSGLSDVVLSRIWDLSDPRGRGCLDKAGFFVSLKLVALAQAGNDINMRNIFLEPPNPPKVGEIPKIIPQSIKTVPVSNADWSMKITDRLKYEQLFEGLNPEKGLIGGNKVKGVLMDSKLPLETLEKIWDLADQDKDGSLDRHEFIVAMHLVYQALDKRAIPTALPPELAKPKPAPANDSFGDSGFVANFPKDIAPPPVPPLPAVMTASIPPISRAPPSVPSMTPLIPSDAIGQAPIIQPALDWVVTPQDRIRFEGIFRESDKDKDGLVSGLEVKNIFIQSGVPQNCLAHIWALCDTNQSGKLTGEQFALAMWMVERKKIGIEPPESLSPNMIPPSLRTTPNVETAASAAITAVQSSPQPTYANPELEMISKEIEELSRERRVLETDIAQKEADIRIKSGEVRSLQSELDTLAATLKQLENQKGEAQKRLDDLKTQNIEVTGALANVNNEIEVTRTQVNKIKDQCQKQEATINEEEGELNSKRSELQKLKDEEHALEKEYDSNRKELDNLTKQLQDTQLQISQVKAMVTQLLETQRQMNDALLLCKAAIEENDAILVSDYSLKIEPDLREAKETLERQEQPKNDPFNESAKSFGASEGFATDAFNKTNGFSSDPFAAGTNGAKTVTSFDDSFATATLGGFDDSFSSSGFNNTQNKDPFGGNADPFGDKKSTAITPEPGKDDFGSDPFAILHAPTTASQILSPSVQKSGPPPRPESPSPALPPKKAKQPPPRPAPPRPLQGPTRPAPPVDGFGSSTTGFADFASFDQQISTLPPPIPSHSSKLPQIQLSSNTKNSSQSQIPEETTPSAVNTTTTSTTTDFHDDPFKDYRYEDPFSIKDPFADEDDDDDFGDTESGDDVFSADSTKNQKLGKNNDTSRLSSAQGLNLKWSPTNKNDNDNNILKTSNLEDNFANFDAFGDSDSNTTSNTDFFDTFNDNFKNVSNKNETTNTSSAFDAFKTTRTITATTTSSSVINNTNLPTFDDSFNQNFEDEFFDTNVSSDRKKKDNDNNSNNNKLNGNFAQFDGFHNLFPTNSSTATNLKKTNNQKKVVEKIPATFNRKDKVKPEDKIDKFSSDYSKSDNFDADLEATLKRSLVDQ